MSKQKLIIAISILLVLVLAVLLGYAFWKKTKYMRIIEKPEQQKEVQVTVSKTTDSLKADICVDSERPQEDIMAKPISQEMMKKILTKEEISNLRGYYFCDGFLKNDSEKACNNFTSKDALVQCKSSFDFFKMIFAMFNGEKEKASAMCRTMSGNSEICKYVGSLQDIKTRDVCAKVSEKEKAFCYAFFVGNEAYCNESENPEFCKQAASFLKVLNSKDESKCDEMASDNELDNRDIFCKLKLSKNQNICIDYKYKKFTQSFCGK